MLTPEDFKIPPIPPVGERRKDKIHLAVGRAINQWEVVEFHLGSLFATLLGTAVPVGALRVYGTVPSFNVRQTMIVEAADALWHSAKNSDMEAEFKRIVRKVCGAAAARRSEIAHGLVIGRHKPDRVHHFLVPSYHSSRKRDHDSVPDYMYTSAEIADFAGKFNLLAGEVNDLAYAILDWRAALQGKPREPQTPPS